MLTISFISLTTMFMSKTKIHNPLIILILSSNMILMMLLMNPLLFNYSKSSFIFMDQLSENLIPLTMFISLLMILCSTNITHKMFNMIIIMLMLILMITFLTQTFMMFYFMFESSLLPTIILILTWGYQPERLNASMFFLMYTLVASLPLLLSIILMMNTSNTTSFLIIYKSMEINQHMMTLLNMTLMIAFLVKLPLFLMHLWLPKAHVEAPLAGSMVLAAILLKLGGFGLMRMMMSFNINLPIKTIIMSLGIWGALLTSLLCLRQYDLKALIAYSSVAHMSFMVASLLTYSSISAAAATMMMVAHAFSSSAMFLLASMNYEMTNSRSLYLNKGMMLSNPIISMWWFLVIASNLAAPPTINLLSEILLIMGLIFMSNLTIILMIILSFIMSIFSFHMYTSLQHGPTPMFTNLISSMNYKMNTTLMLHIIPSIILIMKPSPMMFMM